jgi:hypothetical protein
MSATTRSLRQSFAGSHSNWRPHLWVVIRGNRNRVIQGGVSATRHPRGCHEKKSNAAPAP